MSDSMQAEMPGAREARERRIVGRYAEAQNVLDDCGIPRRKSDTADCEDYTLPERVRLLAARVAGCPGRRFRVGVNPQSGELSVTQIAGDPLVLSFDADDRPIVPEPVEAVDQVWLCPSCGMDRPSFAVDLGKCAGCGSDEPPDGPVPAKAAAGCPDEGQREDRCERCGRVLHDDDGLMNEDLSASICDDCETFCTACANQLDQDGSCPHCEEPWRNA